MRRFIIGILILTTLTVLSCRESNRGDEDTVEAGTVTFEYKPLPGERIETIYLTGDFNSWNPRNIDYLMEPQRDGSFALDVELKPGLYRYRLIINGRWVTNMQSLDGQLEPQPIDYPQHDFGGVNAQIKVTSAGGR